MSDKKNTVIKKMQRYCSAQDRSVQKVKEKLYPITDLSAEEKEEVIGALIRDGFLDDERFAENYVRSKINQNKWGRNKIIQGLYIHRIDPGIIDRCLAGMDAKTYISNILKLYQRKSEEGVDREKLILFFIQKGYDYDEIMTHID